MSIIKENLKTSFVKGSKFFKWILFFLVIIYLFSGTYAISSNEVGVLQRFGKVINSRVTPGIYFSLPWPIDKINKLPVKSVRHIAINDFSLETDLLSGGELFFKLTGLEPCCITGDNNLVVINCVIQYTINNPVHYLFEIVDNEDFLRGIACSTIINCLSKLSINEVLTYGKGEIENYLRINIQKRLDKIGCGLGIYFIELKNINPPGKVQEYFDDVINAQIDKKKIINQADSYRNERIPEAYAEAESIKQQSLSYKTDRIKATTGEAVRFLKQLREYQRAEKVSKERLYVDCLKGVFSRIKKKYFIEKNSNVAPPSLKLMSRE